MLANEKPEIVENARVKANEIILEIRLAELRERLNKTQAEVAALLGVTQPTIAALEKQGKDMKLSSLKSYVEAMGGRATLDIELADGTHFGFGI